MSFLVKGNLSGALSSKYKEPLSGVLVRIYLALSNKQPSATVNGEKKQSPIVLGNKLIAQKEAQLLGEGRTGPEGDYEVLLSNTYNGGPIELDVRVKEVPNQKAPADKCVQFTLRRLQPVWRGEADAFYSYNYCLPYQFWMSIRRKFDAWLICGHIRSEEDRKTPQVGVELIAYDADWIKDDLLGSSTTDNSGFFRIDYSSEDFKRTFLSPIINVETPLSAIPGPGVYFKVKSADGHILYEESKKDGGKEGRKNIPHYYCIDLYVPANNIDSSRSSQDLP